MREEGHRLPARLRGRPWIVTILAATLLAGCGGDDSGSTSADATTADRLSAPEPEQALSKRVQPFETAVADPSCEAAVELIHPVSLPDPDDPTSRSNCGDALYLLRAEAGVKVIGSEELGTGGVVDTTLDGSDESLIWALDGTGRFKWTGAYVATPTAGKELATEAQFQQTADAFTQAVRDEDCHAVFTTFAEVSRLSQDGERAFCDGFDASFTVAPEGLSARLQKDSEAKPELLGRTEGLAVFGLATAPAGYRTLLVGVPRPGDAPVVIDVVPAER
jgi:hypothetical protein